MKLDLPTLAFMLSLTGITQVIAFYIQYRVNSTYRGIGWWLLGSMAMSLGFITLSFAEVPAIAFVSVVGIPLLILGRAGLFIGTSQFFNQKVNRAILSVTCISFIGAYYYFLFFHESITCRTVLASAGIALLSLLNAFVLFRNRTKAVAAASYFTGAIFTVSGFQLIFVIIYTLASKQIHSYLEYSLPQIMLFVLPAITSMLWTFGFILMVNQRLASDNLEERENLRRMFNTSPDASLIIRLEDGVLVDANQGYLQMTGYTREEIIGNSALSVCRWNKPADPGSFLATMKEKGSCENLEIVSRHRDGTEYVGMISARVITIQDLPHIISVTRDITARRKVEVEKADLDAKFQQLQKAESLGRMAGAIAHHFNNQLHAVLANLEMLGQPSKGADSARLLARAKQATDRAAEMSGLMLVYLGQTSHKQEPRDLSVLCRSCVAALQARLPESAALSVDFPLPGPTVLVNADQIQQALLNLTVNAAEALGRAGGTVRLGIRTLPATAIPAANRFPINWRPQAPDYAWLEVTDDGSGIPEADLENLFDPFFSTRFTGRGLGLPVVLGIVQAHGGAVTLASRLGEGSVFRIHLPLGEGDGRSGPGAD